MTMSEEVDVALQEEVDVQDTPPTSEEPAHVGLPEDREVLVPFGWCMTGECEKCLVWNRWTHCIYVCNHDCHKGKNRPPLAPLDPPWDALPKKKKTPPAKRPAKAKTLTPEPAPDMIEPEAAEEADDSQTRESEDAEVQGQPD